MRPVRLLTVLAMGLAGWFAIAAPVAAQDRRIVAEPHLPTQVCATLSPWRALQRVSGAMRCGHCRRPSTNARPEVLSN